MKEEKFTDKELERFATDQSASATWQYVKRLASELIEERKQPKVWDGAPEWAKIARIEYENIARQEDKRSEKRSYTRDLPKSKARVIAEETMRKIVNDIDSTNENMVTAVESAIIEYAKDNGSNT